MKRLWISLVALIACIMLAFTGISAAVSWSMPAYKDSVGSDNYTEKITGLYLVEQSATRGDNLIIYGSSELRTMEISTHPANFFAGKRCGFQINLVGRGSCQSLIHAISIAATGDALTGKKVVLITSPQSYVREGIAPDLFMANFSAQQYMELMRSPDISEDVKQYISARVLTLFERYEAMPDSAWTDTAVRYLAEHGAEPTVATGVRNTALSPYYVFSQHLYRLKDMVTARTLLESLEEPSPIANLGDIDWYAEEQAVLADAEQMTDNNDFGILNDYYTTYIGTRLSRQENRDQSLSYSVSEEYDDLRILFEICRQKGIEPLFIHVPLHGRWNDYTGFKAGHRKEYYENVRQIVGEYEIRMLDLTGYEYEDYFLCDVMHLGWKGWLEVDRALIDYYYDR